MTLHYVAILLIRFSRKVMWLKLSTTNRDPAVILDYYLECVSNTKGMMLIIKSYVICMTIALLCMYSVPKSDSC